MTRPRPGSDAGDDRLLREVNRAPEGGGNDCGVTLMGVVLPVVALGNHLHEALPPDERETAIAALPARRMAAISAGRLVVASDAPNASVAQADLLAVILAVAPASRCGRVACGLDMPFCPATCWP